MTLFRLETINEDKIISSYSVRVIQRMIDSHQSQEILIVHVFKNDKDIIPSQSLTTQQFEQWTTQLLQQ
jgi:hypothetical protein